MNLPHEFVELLEEFHLPASLVDLDLNRCKNIPKGVRHIAVESLILERSDLEYLPQGFGYLKKLKHLSMDNCSKPALLSKELGVLSSLETLSIKGCLNMRALPESLVKLLSLQMFELSECKLQELPESIGELNLQLLLNLYELPNSFGIMTLFKDLSLQSCHLLISLPDSFVELKILETLNIINCTKLSVLAEEFGRLRCLKCMIGQDCPLLKELLHGFGALPALKTFMLDGDIVL